MLRRLRIQNHALIADAELHLTEGFHVFTGETGSGKSILLGALGLLLGDRADTSGVGLHGDRAVIEGDFSASDFSDWLVQQELPTQTTLTLRREILRNGRSRVFINDAQATVQQLRELGESLVDIHRQQHLGVWMEREKLCEWLDRAGQHQEAIQSYVWQFEQWGAAKKEHDRLVQWSREPSGDLNYLKHQLEELQSAELGNLDWEELQSELSSLEHASDIHDGIAQALHSCDADDTGALVRLDQAKKALRGVEGRDKDVDEVMNRLQSMRIELHDMIATLEDLMDIKQPNPTRLSFLQEQHDVIVRLMRKHGVEHPSELTTLVKKLEGQVFDLSDMDRRLEEAEKQAERAWLAMTKCGEELMHRRMEASRTVTTRVLPLLSKLKMPHAQMEWRFPSCPPDLLGMNSPEIWFSTNPGSPLLPLSKVASGGEKARFLLALKAVLAGLQGTPAVVFDEIDTGVSGEVASHMGQTMRDIALSPHTAQVLAVTHLPQVAALAHKHWEVSKATDGTTTHVHIEPLTSEGRQRAVASLLSGEEITPEALRQASRLIELNASA